MSWLNWSLKLHIRLRTISFLVPTHITHVYVQWMPYSLIKHKKIFECFNCFWKVFLFWKIPKISKTVQPHISSFRFLVLGVLMIYVNMMLEYGYLLFWCDCVVGFDGFVLLLSAFSCTMWYLWHTLIQWHD